MVWRTRLGDGGGGGVAGGVEVAAVGAGTLEFPVAGVEALIVTVVKRQIYGVVLGVRRERRDVWSAGGAWHGGGGECYVVGDVEHDGGEVVTENHRDDKEARTS